MNTLRNLLALIGLLALIAVGVGYAKYGKLLSQFGAMSSDLAVLDQFDPKARQVYTDMWQTLKQTGISADATVWKVPLADGITPEDAEASMKLAANEHNIKAVGELPLSEQVALEKDKPQRLLKIFQYCNPQTAMLMVDYSDAFSAYLPCRVALVQDKAGKYNLYSLNMDMMIYGGKPLPPELHAEAVKVKTIIQDIMKRGAAGDL